MGYPLCQLEAFIGLDIQYITTILHFSFCALQFNYQLQNVVQNGDTRYWWSPVTC